MWEDSKDTEGCEASGLRQAHVGHVHQLYGLLFFLYYPGWDPGRDGNEWRLFGETIFSPGAKDFQFLLISNEYTRPLPAAVKPIVGC